MYKLMAGFLKHQQYGTQRILGPLQAKKHPMDIQTLLEELFFLKSLLGEFNCFVGITSVSVCMWFGYSFNISVFRVSEY